ncbi:MAG TPA: hypothetical protein VIM16_03815 [Mucilaginibacter sp.]|jgi:hypothetical protein
MELAGRPFSTMLLRRLNTWYTIRDGNWSDPTIWMSNALDKKNVLLPRVGDNVVINHNVTADTTTPVNDLDVNGSLIAISSTGVTLTINGNCRVNGNGLISLPSQFHNLILNGYFNQIPSTGFNGGAHSTVIYGALVYNQSILNLPYKNLTTQGAAKYQISDITVGGNLATQSTIYDCGVYNLTVSGSSVIGSASFQSKFYKTGAGNLLFIGNVDFEDVVDLSGGNPNIEFRGGITFHLFNFNSGTGTATFTTNNQTIAANVFSASSIWNSPIIVSGAITITLTGSGGNGIFQTSSTINGTVAGSTFNNEGVLYLGNSSTPMTTGVFNYNHISTSTIGYVFNGSVTLPQSSFANLVIGGTGTKTLLANTTINKTLVNNGGLDTGGYNLTVTGTFTNGNSAGAGDFTASVSSAILFIGFVQINSGGSIGFDLTGSNPNVEFRGGLDVHSASPTKTGTGTWSFTTNNQNVSFSAYLTGSSAANWLISGAITATFTSGGTIPNFTGTLDGDNASSIFDCRGTFMYQNATAPMATAGKLYCNQATNAVIYGLAGNQDIQVPSDSTSPGYKNLTLQGSGAKKLLGNVSVKGVYTLTSPATLNSNGFALTNP